MTIDISNNPLIDDDAIRALVECAKEKTYSIKTINTRIRLHVETFYENNPENGELLQEIFNAVKELHQGRIVIMDGPDSNPLLNDPIITGLAKKARVAQQPVREKLVSMINDYIELMHPNNATMEEKNDVISLIITG